MPDTLMSHDSIRASTVKGTDVYNADGEHLGTIDDIVIGLMGGAGVLAYALLWIFVPQRPRRRAGRRTGQPAGTPAGLRRGRGRRRLADRGRRAGVRGFAGLGARPARPGGRSAPRSSGGRPTTPGGPAGAGRAAGIVGPSTGSWWRLIGGCLLVVGGLSVFAIGQLDFTAVRSALIAVVLTLVGVAIITIPWWLRLVRDLGDERRGRVQERERAEIAAHLHDSVLQTLALIQRQAGDSREVQRLARSQERQLRTWLYGPAGYASAGDASRRRPSSSLRRLAGRGGRRGRGHLRHRRSPR